MELKSHHLEMSATVILVVGLIAGIVAGSIFPTMVEKTRPAYNFGDLYSEVYFESVYNGFLTIAIMVSSVITAFMTWFCSAVLFHLEQNRKFNKKAIALLEKIVEQQAAHTVVEASEQPAEVAASE